MANTSAYLAEKRGRFYGVFRANGKKRWVSLGTGKRKAAEAKLDALRVDFFRGTYDPWKKKSRLTSYDVGDTALVDQFLLERARKGLAASSIKTYGYVLRPFVRDTSHRDSWQERVDAFLATSVSPGTRNSRVNILKTFFSWAVMSHYVPDMPDLQSTGRNVTRDEVTEEQMVMIVDEARASGQDWLASAVEFMYWSGLRLGELIRMNHADLRDGWIRLPKTKRGEPQGVPITEKLASLLRGLGGPRIDAVFPGPDGRRIQARTMQRQFRRACDRIGLTHATIHGLRHGFCTMLARGGANEFVIMGLARHQDVKTSQGYIHMVKDDLRKAANEIIQGRS